MAQKETRKRILEIAGEVLASEGMGAVSFDRIARELGKSKQAVLYWFPTKYDLLAALFLPWLKKEAEVAELAVNGSRNRNEAVAAFVKAVADLHLQNIERYRLTYLLPQTIHSSSNPEPQGRLLEAVHPVTSRTYDALAPFLGSEQRAARQEAVAIHAAVLGLVMMVGLSERLKDPLKHTHDELVDGLIRSLCTP